MTATAPIDQQGSPLLDQLEQDDFFGRWETAWNTHDLDFSAQVGLMG